MSRVDDGLRPEFRARVPSPVFWQSVETGSVQRGVADSFFCAEGAQGWIEYKATDGWTAELRPEQAGWLTALARHGGRGLVAVRRRRPAGSRSDPADELYLYGGHVARELLVWGLRPAPDCPKAVARRLLGARLGLWRGGPARWAWSEVRAAMLTAPSRPAPSPD